MIADELRWTIQATAMHSIYQYAQRTFEQGKYGQLTSCELEFNVPFQHKHGYIRDEPTH